MCGCGGVGVVGGVCVGGVMAWGGVCVVWCGVGAATEKNGARFASRFKYVHLSILGCFLRSDYAVLSHYLK